MREKIQIAVDRLNRAIEKHNPIAVVGLFSGGHDSFSACYVNYVAREIPRVVHIATGIGVQATEDYVKETCARWRWPLWIYRAMENVQACGKPDPQNYDDIVRQHGFPGPAGHSKMYIRLKQRQLQRLERDLGANCRGKEKHRVMLVSGCRSQESERRMGTVEEVAIEGRRIWVAPIHDWTKLDTTKLLDYVGQPRNPVVDLIHKSGECLCGAFAKPGELKELGMWDLTRPAYERIKALQAEVLPRFHHGWGERPPRRATKQLKLGPLCWNCSIGGTP
jgi:3'-phosphoadenosine 5'-phosphosulfate sulfotransferase (PAPS reductase)/FAD synthetase